MDERYAVVSCHVERPLDDRAWQLFARLQERRPGGFRIAALMRPPDEEAGEDPALWLERAREAASLGPLGHHTHWGGPGQARPLGGDPAERVQREGAWLREQGLRPTVFCGGGWYLDAEVAGAAAELGYADCTATAFQPRYLQPGAARLGAQVPSRLTLPGGGELLELPTTHSLGMLARALAKGIRAGYVHVYFHDTDLLHRLRAAAVETSLRVLARRYARRDLDALVRSGGADLPVNEAFAR
jgi:hypothetical protein